MSQSPDQSGLEYIINHVFCPLKLPQESDHSVENDLILSEAVINAAVEFTDLLPSDDRSLWKGSIQMLQKLKHSIRFSLLSAKEMESQIGAMDNEDVLVYMIRAQNAAVIIRKLESETVFESFEVSPDPTAVMGAKGKLICSYPGPAIAVPNTIVADPTFVAELANFLVHMDQDILDAAPTTTKAGSTVLEERDTAHPRYITELLTGILRGLGSIADVPRIRKRIGDDVLCNGKKLPWRRSPLWLVIRVALQTTLERSALGRNTYKSFILFFMKGLIKLALDDDLPNDILHFMAAKIARRLFKLGSSALPQLSQMTSEVTDGVRDILEERWRSAQDTQKASPPWAPQTLRVLDDTHLSLNTSREYISNALKNQHSSPSPTPFVPSHYSRGTIDDFLDDDASFLQAAYLADPSLALADFETVVRLGIDDWMARVSSRSAEVACISIEVCANAYSSRALKAYKGNPENLSIMLITLFELWVALDKVAVRQIPLLAQYSTEIPLTLMERLLIRKSSILNRFKKLYAYIRARNNNASNHLSVFESISNVQSFAQRYFDQSSELRELKSSIEMDAMEARKKKKIELQDLHQRYNGLCMRNQALSHTRPINIYGREEHYSWSCSKCQLEQEMREMTITVHEWPLPAGELDAKAVVFELACPMTFDIWRSMTFHILFDICTPKVIAHKPEAASDHTSAKLPQYPALHHYRQCRSQQRLTLASSASPFANSHYNNPHIPTTEVCVCVNNGLNFRPFDLIRNAWVADMPRPLSDSSDLCTFLIPEGPYVGLQQYLAEISHTSNKIIANQADCHRDITIHEYIAFGVLRSGPLLQWMNVLRELRARVLNFRREEVLLLLAQTISQVGPLSSDDEPIWHQELNDVRFINALFGELESLMRSVERNWLEVVTISTITMLVSRALSSTEEEKTRSCGYSLLRLIRTTTFTLLKELAAKLQASSDEMVAQELQGRVRDMAFTCRSTFDVDGDPSFLLTSDEDLKVFAYCAALIHDNTPKTPYGLSQYSQLLLERDKRCCHALEAAMRQYAGLHREGLDCAMKEIWGSYRQGTPWEALPAPNARWLLSRTASSDSQLQQEVHFNLISGCLLVDGKSLGRLPSAIMQHPTYQTIFGNQVLDVVPADIAGMEYATRGTLNGHQVSFALHSDDLIIRAKSIEPDSPVLQLIPSKKFTGDLPDILIAGHTHWLDLRTSQIEIRPAEKAWIFSPENWRLYFSSSDSWLKKDGATTLVDIRSQTWEMISNRVRPLEDPKYMMVTCDVASDHASSPKPEVDLTRYGLEFFVDEDWELQSRNMRNMVVDNIRSTGTMLGLSNQLVLRPKLQVADAHPRTVIIPNGLISHSPDGHHVCVTIVPEGPQATYYLYRVDSDLCCLTGNAGLTSKLYQAFLHALTSSNLPDPLTGRTGTEEALHILHSAACRSFMKLCTRDADLLRQINSLSSDRVWYPTHLHKMQTVSWLPLSSLAQHHGFHTAAKSIMDYGKRLSAFSEGSSETTFHLPSRTDHLLERASIRASVVYPNQFSLPIPHGDVDVIYASHDIPDKMREEKAFNTAFMVHQWPSQLPSHRSLLDVLTRWDKFRGIDKALNLRYSNNWFQPMSSIFLSAYDLCRSVTKKETFQLVFTLTSVAYGLQDNHALVPTLLSFATVPDVRALGGPPGFTLYDFSDGFMPSDGVLDGFISSCVIDFESSSERYLAANYWENESDVGRRRYSAFVERYNYEKRLILSRVKAAWSCEDPPTLDWSDVRCYKLSILSAKLRPLFRSCWANRSLKQHLDSLQTLLDRSYAPNRPSKSPSQYRLEPYFDHIIPPASSSVDAQWLFNRSPPVLCTFRSFKLLPSIDHHGLVSPTSQLTARLRNLTDNFRSRKKNEFHHKYADDLDSSMSIFCKEKVSVLPDPTSYVTDSDLLLELYSRHSKQFHKSLGAVQDALSPASEPENALYHAGLWPRVTPNFLFSHMASVSGSHLGKGWHATLVRLSQTLLQLQRSRRLLVFATNRNWVEFFKELDNEECDGYDPESYPDWLLIQIESQFIARPVQVKVAQEMMSPSTGRNASLQLNMGEGKSYVIIPLVAAALSDGHKLVRVIVLKSLSAQMFQLLVERLSGLTQRRIFHVPFSRSLSVDSEKVQMYHSLMQECMDNKGILVAQPDHILSFHLMTVEQQLSPQPKAAAMFQVQRWLDNNTRDVLDESDEILHVRYQLVYTVGLQMSLQGYPDRWTITQQVLTLVAKHAARLMHDFPSKSEVSIGIPGTFPFIRVLCQTAGEQLMQWIAQDIIGGILDNISFDRASLDVKDAIRQFIVTEAISDDCIKLVEDHYKVTTAWHGLLVLRGLLACGILMYALKERRFRVNYGLSPMRTMLAVPFRAKDTPSLRAEFGHPDIAVTLTCLSYYYTGLTLEQLLVCFDILLKQDNPDLEYESWVFGLPSAPESLRRLNGINTESTEQRSDLLRLFALNKAVIDFYLSCVVFPKEAKSFPHKLACSGWDLAQEKTHLTTGFSGTNDNRYILPSSIVQHDLDCQRSTNARVLSFLLLPENDYYRCIPSGQKVGKFLGELVAQTPEVRVLLDVGAQMLELRNQELAKAWLRVKHDAKAAVFVNDDDELVVVSRNGKVEQLVSSPFAQQLDQCIVYLDDAHTRGTDVKLPSGFRAAVTLGPKVTKDRLAQGCMRMRKLGNGHSIMFFAPVEVDQSIRAAVKKAEADVVDVSDILHWVMLETCTDIQIRALHWAQQGSDFEKRHSAWHGFSPSPMAISDLKTAWLQPEERSLEDLYAPRSVEQPSEIFNAEIRRKCEALGVPLVAERTLDEEQEREVVHEVERERQVERPPKVDPAAHVLHAHVVRFIQMGRIPTRSSAFLQVFSSLNNTTAPFPEDHRWAPNVLVTQDFARTVSNAEKVDDYLRPVNWVVCNNSRHSPVLVVMSPHEVDSWLPDIRRSSAVHLCIYTPRTSKAMATCDDLQLYSIPSDPQLTPLVPLIFQLNLFSGQLYFSNFEMYLRTCNFLGIKGPDLRGEAIEVDNDGIIKKENRPAATTSCPFKQSQLRQLKGLFGMRRKGMGYRSTHLGKLLDGRILHEEDF